MTDKTQPKWLDRFPIAHADHVPDLETRAACHEFISKLPRHEAEQKAHDDYKHDQLVDCAAHHYVGLQAAHAAGDKDVAKKHAVVYALAIKQLDPKHNPAGEPPDEVMTRAKNTPAKIQRYKAHLADSFALPKADEAKPESKD